MGNFWCILAAMQTTEGVIVIEQLKTIRSGIEKAHIIGGQDAIDKALTALTHLEAMVGAQEPVAWAVYWGLPPTRKNSVHFDKESAQAVANQIKSATEVRPLYAAPVAQQPQARPDFTDEWTGYLKDGETPFERFLRERKDMQSVLKLYQRALEENERLKAQPQAEAVLTDAVILDVARNMPNPPWGIGSRLPDAVAFARAIEQAVLAKCSIIKE